MQERVEGSEAGEAEVSAPEVVREGASAALAEVLREQAEALGERVRQRQVPKAQVSAARGWLRQVYGWESDPAAPLRPAVRLVREGEALLGEGASRQARVEFAWWMFHRLMRRWPATVPCLHRVRMERAAAVTEAMVDARLDRLDAIFGLLKVEWDFASREVKPRKLSAADMPDREIVKKQGST